LRGVDLSARMVEIARQKGKPLVLNLLNNILSYGTKIAILN